MVALNKGKVLVKGLEIMLDLEFDDVLEKLINVISFQVFIEQPLLKEFLGAVLLGLFFLILIAINQRFLFLHLLFRFLRFLLRLHRQLLPLLWLHRQHVLLRRRDRLFLLTRSLLFLLLHFIQLHLQRSLEVFSVFPPSLIEEFSDEGVAVVVDIAESFGITL